MLLSTELTAGKERSFLFHALHDVVSREVAHAFK